jgi:hypothetical protein
VGAFVEVGTVARANAKTVVPAVALVLGLLVLLWFMSLFTLSPPLPHLGREAANAFRREVAQALMECPNLECLRTASKDCRPAHFAKNIATVEGSVIPTETFVFNAGTKCSAVGFYDYTADYWGGCRLVKRTCGTVDGLHKWDEVDCSQVVLQQIKPCDPPF